MEFIRDIHGQQNSPAESTISTQITEKYSRWGE